MNHDNPTYRALQAEVSDLRAVVCKLSSQSRQLFAVVFRDGGHRFSDLGEDYDRAFAGAEAEVLRLIHSNDELLETEKEAVRLLADLEDAEGQALKLQAFKDWVHNYLDAHGVPHHPPGTHGEAGCRIGDRMDWLMAKLEDAEREIAEIGRGEFRQKPLATEAGGE